MTSKYGVPRILPDGKINNEYLRRQYAARRDKVRAYSAKWRAAHPDKIRGYQQKYYNNNRDQWLARDREAHRKYRLLHRDKHLITMRKFHLKRGYNMTLDDYVKMLVAQNYKCAICGKKHEEAPRKRLHVDHDHKTGKVRALLCNNCNNLIGRSMENINVLKRAIEYIESHRD